MILPPGAPREPRKRATPPVPIRLEGTANMDAPNLLGAEYGEVPFQFEIIEYVPRQMYEKLRDDMLALRGQPWPTETRYVPEQSTFQERLWQRLKRLAPTTWAGGSGYCRDRTPAPQYLGMERAVDLVLDLLQKKEVLPYSARVREFSALEVACGALAVADMRAELQNRAFARAIVKAARREIN